MSIDVTDATFQTEVIEKSATTPVVVDLWAPWCGPCKTLGPIIEKVVAETNGKVILAKINVDDNPQSAAAFQVQGIPAVYALKDGKIVNGFVGAQGEQAVRDFVDGLLPTDEESEIEKLIAAGDEASLVRALELEPDNEQAVLALAKHQVEAGAPDVALSLLERVPESPESRHIAALARTGGEPTTDIEGTLDGLLGRVKGDEDARQEFLDLLEVLGPDDPRTAQYRRRLTSALF